VIHCSNYDPFALLLADAKDVLAVAIEFMAYGEPFIVIPRALPDQPSVFFQHSQESDAREPTGPSFTFATASDSQL
jgi:hypothetical protein